MNITVRLEYPSINQEEESKLLRERETALTKAHRSYFSKVSVICRKNILQNFKSAGEGILLGASMLYDGLTSYSRGPTNPLGMIVTFTVLSLLGNKSPIFSLKNGQFTLGIASSVADRLISFSKETSLFLQLASFLLLFSACSLLGMDLIRTNSSNYIESENAINSLSVNYRNQCLEIIDNYQSKLNKIKSKTAYGG